MDQLIGQATAFLEANPSWVIAVAALSAFGEALLIVGVFIPGTTLLAFIGGMAASGLVDPVPAALAGIVGGVLGDATTYAIGRVTRRPILRWAPLRPHRRKIAAARLFFRRYGMWSVLIGRFFGPLRATVPLIAGVFGMRQWPFLFANVVSAMIWAPVVMLPGWLAARGVAQIGGLDPATWLLAFVGLSLVLALVPVVVLRWLVPDRRSKRRP